MDDETDGEGTANANANVNSNSNSNNKKIAWIVVIGLVVAGIAISNRKDDELDKIGDKAARCTRESILTNTTSSECRE